MTQANRYPRTRAALLYLYAEELRMDHFIDEALIAKWVQTEMFDIERAGLSSSTYDPVMPRQMMRAATRLLGAPPTPLGWDYAELRRRLPT